MSELGAPVTSALGLGAQRASAPPSTTAALAHARCAGGNLGFETAAFKLSYEMTQILDPGMTRNSGAVEHESATHCLPHMPVPQPAALTHARHDTTVAPRDVSPRARAETFRKFCELTIRCFLVARSVADGTMATVAMMASSQLPCFGYGKPLEGLRQRFRLELSPSQAAAHMRAVIMDACDKWTTGGYDLIQYMQQNIPR